MTKAIKRCTICQQKLAKCNPKKTCFRHDLKPNHDPIGDGIRRESIFSSGPLGGMAMKTYLDEKGFN